LPGPLFASLREGVGVLALSAAAVWAGIDLGGTGTRVALVTSSGETVAGITVPTSSFDDDAVERLADRIRELIPPGVELSGIGIGASGPVDLATGRIRNPHTLPQFTDLDVAGDLQMLLSTPTWIDNDAVVAGLAESTWGAGFGARSVLSVTLGTGIGAVLIKDEHPVRAADGQHPEGGHIAVAGAGSPCYCGLPQCWEQVASRTALDRLRQTHIYSASELWLEYADRIASGLVSLLTLYHPASVVIGGSVAQHWNQLKDPLRRALTPFREFDPSARLDASQLGERAGALGAALLPQRRIGWHPG
jgi:glucokinase